MHPLLGTGRQLAVVQVCDGVVDDLLKGDLGHHVRGGQHNLCRKADDAAAAAAVG